MGTRRGRRSVLVAVIVSMLLLPLVGGGDVRAAREGQTDIPERQRLTADDGASDPRVGVAETMAQKHEKLDGGLAFVASAASGRIAQSPLAIARSRALTVVDDSLVRVIVESAGSRPATAAAVRAVGGRIELEVEDVVQALVAPAMLDALAASPAVAYVSQPDRGFPDAVTGQGVAASGASTWQTGGITGQGIKVGIIDGGFAGYQARQAAGDLPSNLIVQDFCNGNVNTAGFEHGTAVAEIVYEMAPGIQLYLLCADLSSQLVQAKDYAKANGIAIIVMSVSYFNTSRGDGTGSSIAPNTTVADARANGILWVNSAGNRAQQHYSATFSDTDGNGNHNYSPSDNGNTIFLSTNQQACVFLRWDNWPTTNQDLDLYLQISSTGVNVAQSTGAQTGSQAPVEQLCYTNTTGTAQNFAIVVRKFNASANPFFDMFIAPAPNLEHQVAAGSVTEPGSSQNAFTAAAICWQNDRRESYSSQGPTIDGRIKPDISGQSNVSSGSFGAFVSCPNNANGQGGFNGTSAAAPHVGGAAVLAKLVNSQFTPSQVQLFLEGRATDLGTAGKDNLFGSGKLQLGAFPLDPPNCAPRPPVTVSSAVSGGRLAVTVAVTGINNLLLNVTTGNGARSPVNALIDVPDGRTGLTGVQTFVSTTGLTQATFWLRRQAGGAITVPIVVTDRCGTWPTFVGAGPGTGAF